MASATRNLQQGNPDDTPWSWMDALPDHLLAGILRRASRPVRQVCRRWRDAYGPPFGLYLKRTSTRRDLLKIIIPGPSATALSGVHSLFLPSSTGEHPINGAVLRSLPTCFPDLRALDIHTNAGLAPAQVPLLAPLAPHLTALTLHLQSPAAAAHLATALPSLRALSFRPVVGRSTNPLLLHDYLRALAPLLPTLRRFKYMPDTGMRVHSPASSVLPLLATMSQVTSLQLSTALTNWDHPLLTHLANAWPRLASLQLWMDPTPPEGAPSPPSTRHPTPDDLTAALSRRTALKSLTLYSLPPALPSHHRLAALTRLSALNVLSYDYGYSTQQLTSLLAPLAPALPLARLTIDDGNVHLTAEVVSILTQLGPTLRHFTFVGHVGPVPDLQPLSRLSMLQTLCLYHNDYDYAGPGGNMWWDPPTHPPPQLARALLDTARSIGAALRHLTSLALLDYGMAWPVDALLAAVAAHGRLRYFQTNRYLPHLAACLAPARDSLTRLDVRAFPGLVHVTIQSLAGMEALRALLIDVFGCSAVHLRHAAPGRYNARYSAQQRPAERQRGCRKHLCSRCL